MSVIITIIHVFVAIALIMIVLLQTGKGADMGIAFGGGSSQTLFGTTGASTFLSKSTTVIAVIFMVTTFSLTYMWGNRNESSIMTDYEVPVQGDVQNSENQQGQQPIQKVDTQVNEQNQSVKQQSSEKTEMVTQQATVMDNEKPLEETSVDLEIPGPDKTKTQ
jgi:preprotein translocase subunit SecG